jgi:hypothetical protein
LWSWNTITNFVGGAFSQALSVLVEPFNNLGQGLQNIGSQFTSALDHLNYTSDNFILKGTLEKLSTLLGRLNPISDDFILKGSLEKISSVLDRLNYTSDNFILKGTMQHLQSMLNRVNPASDEFMLNSTIRLLSDFFDSFNPDSDRFIFKVLFVPEPNYISDKNDQLENALKDKAYIEQYIGLLEGISQTTPETPELTKTINVYGIGSVTGKFLNTSFYHEYKNMMFTIIRAVIAIGLLIFNINQISKLLTRSNFVDGSFNQTGASDKK